MGRLSLGAQPHREAFSIDAIRFSPCFPALQVNLRGDRFVPGSAVTTRLLGTWWCYPCARLWPLCIRGWILICPHPLTPESQETHSHGVRGVGFLRTSTQHHQLEGSDAISIGEEGPGAAIVLIAGLLRHRTGPGISQFALKTIIAKQYVGDAFALR